MISKMSKPKGESALVGTLVVAIAALIGWQLYRTLLTATYDREGIGIVISPNKEVYVTQNFC